MKVFVLLVSAFHLKKMERGATPQDPEGNKNWFQIVSLFTGLRKCLANIFTGSQNRTKCLENGTRKKK